MLRRIFIIVILLSISVAITFIYYKTQQADINYYQGHRHFKQGYYNKAIKFYKRALSSDPSHAKALEDLAYSYQWAGRYNQAIDTFQKYLSLNPKDNDAKLSLSRTYSWIKEYEKAILLCEEVIRATDSIDAKKQLAEICIWNNQPDRAIVLLEEILKNNPDDTAAKLLLAKAKQYSGKTKEAVAIYEELLEEKVKKQKDEEELSEEIEELLGQAYMIGADYDKAIAKYKKILEKNPKNLKVRIALADILSWNKEYDESIREYKEALRIEPRNIEAKKKLADVISWDKRYAESLNLYDEILDETENAKVRLQKARILGWARQYSKSLREYRKILDTQYDELIELEMNAKKAYWNNHVKSAILYYKELIRKNPQNVEAMFDLSQIYSYQSMWKEAIGQYKKILDVSPVHLRAREGLKKINLISKRVSLKTGYEFFEADSKGRKVDIKRHSFFNRLDIPVTYNFTINTDYELTGRNFSDFGNVIENKARIGFAYRNTPQWWLNGFYDFISYNKDIDDMHTFGSDINSRILDAAVVHFSFDREQLENTSTLIKKRYYCDNYKTGLDFDINKRIKLGTDYLYSYYSDGNYKNEPGLDLLYYIFFEPKKLTFRYSCFFREFNDKVDEYFSPKGFWTNTFAFNWRHFLNKDEIFFGADDIYYDAGYKVSVDSKDIVVHTFGMEYNWDINKRLNLNVKGAITDSSVNTYKDKNITISIKYYF